MLERWLAFGVLVGLLLVFASWANEDEAPESVEPAEGLPPEMPDDDDDEREREPRKPDSKRPRGIVGGLLGDD